MRLRDERGVGSVLTVGLALAMFTVTGVVAMLIGWFADVRQAEQVAEVAALAGASAAAQGADPCRAASAAAAHNGREIGRCLVRGAGADVVVEVGIRVTLTPDLGTGTFERLATAGTM